MSATQVQLECTATVHDLMHRYPAPRAVFERHGVDTCCGSRVSVEEAARRDGLDPVQLCAELRAAAANGLPADG
jgi:iron-sulfur cluster repair protein YtfE (RIC family)